MAEPQSHSRTLFVTQDGVPMRFYVRPGPSKRQLAPLITQGGGVVCRIQEPGAFLLADPAEGQLGPGYISNSYITDCVSSNRNLSPRAYRLLPVGGLMTGTGLWRSLTSRLAAAQWAPRENEDHKGRPTVVPTNNGEAALQGQRENGNTSVTTRDGETREREDNMEEMGNLSKECAREDEEDLKGSSTVDPTNKEEDGIQSDSETCTSMIATMEKEATGEKEYNKEKKGITSHKRVLEDEEGLTNKEEVGIQCSSETTSMVATTEEATRGGEGNEEKKGFTSPNRDPGDEGHKGSSTVDLINKEVGIQGNSETCMVATTEEATRREGNEEKKGFTIPNRAPGDKEGHKGSTTVDLTNKEEVGIQGGSETCTYMVATTEEATGGREGNEEKKGFTSPKIIHGDKEGHKGSSTVDLTNKDEAFIQGNKETCSSLVTTTEEATGERKDKMDRMTMASRKDMDHSIKSPASKKIPTKPASECGDDLKMALCTSSSDITCMEAATGDNRDNKNTEGTTAAHSTSSRAQTKSPTLSKMDVEQTINVDENYSTLDVPDPRTSTPGPGNPNTVKDLVVDTTVDSALLKVGESNCETQFRRPKRKVASITRFGVGENQHNPNMKQRRAEKKTEEKPRNVTQMSVDEKHCGQAVESHNAESPAGQLEHTVEAETGSQKNTAKELDGQSQQIQSVIPLQVHKPAAALRQGRMAFTKEEDIAILIYIRDNASSSCTVTGNLLWKDMEKKKVLSRTWQAMKARYVKYIVDQKHKYKLPPKCSTLPSKGCSSKRKQGSDKTNSSWLNCTSTSTMTPKNCDTIHPRASTVIPQNCDTTQPSAPTDIPQNCDTIQTKASNDIPENCNATQLSASNDIPQNCDIIQPNGSADIHQNCETNLSSASVENCDPTQPSASADIPQNCDTILPSGSADIPQKCDTNLSNASADIPQNCDSTQPSISASISQNCATTQPSASTGTLQRNYTMPPTGSSITPQRANTMPSTASAVNLQKCVTMLPSASTDTLLKNDSMLPTAFAVTPKKHNTMLPSPFAHTPQKSDAMLPSTSADTYLTCSVTQHGAFTSANSLVTNIASKEQSISTLEKRSSDPTNDESPPQKKGNKMLTSHSPKTILPDREDSSDLDDLHIFEIANMEFEETDGNSGLEQPAPAVSQTENHNSASHVDETPSTSQASESEGLREAMNDMMTEFRLDVSVVTQALFFNSGELGSTRYFLRTGTRPDGYPIWEPKDDLELKNNNPKMQSHLINKYGADNVARRVAFLAS